MLRRGVSSVMWGVFRASDAWRWRLHVICTGPLAPFSLKKGGILGGCTTAAGEGRNECVNFISQDDGALCRNRLNCNHASIGIPWGRAIDLNSVDESRAQRDMS